METTDKKDNYPPFLVHQGYLHWVQNDIFLVLLTVAAIVVTGCSTTMVEVKTKGPEEKHIYKISSLGFSRDIRKDAISSADEFCTKQNKHFKLVRNIILPKSVGGVDMVSIDLFFDCLDQVAKAPLPKAEPQAEPPPPPVAELPPSAAEPAPPVAEAPPAPETKGKEPPLKPQSPPQEAISKAVVVPVALKPKPLSITGDTPGEPESLGEPTELSKAPAKPAKPEAIIEEVLDK